MKRRTLDIIFASGGLLLAGMMLVLGLVLADQYNWGKDYVKEELGSQKITFTAADKLTAEEKDWKPGSSCLTKYAGQLMTTGAQAECYAKFYIGLHLEESAKALKLSAPLTVNIGGKDENLATMEGQTYATLGTVRTALLADQKALTDKGDKTAADARQKDADAVASLRTTQQTGETLRGLLLTSFGFSIFGDKANTVAQIAYIVAALLAILSIAGFVHAWMAKDAKVFDAKAPVTRAGAPAPVN
ncbi:MAG: hypothetical protein ABI577_11235 [bacterium]